MSPDQYDSFALLGDLFCCDSVTHMQEKVLECVLLEGLQAANFFEALLVSVHF